MLFFYKRTLKTINELKTTAKCLQIMQLEGFRMDYRVGVLIKEAPGLLTYDAWSIVLYSKSEYSGNVTIERAMTKHEIDEQRRRGSALRATCTMVGVPSNYIKDISFLFNQ